MSPHPLLLVSRRDLLDACNGPGGERLVSQLAGLTRRGYRLVTMASQPDEWSRSKAESKRCKPPSQRIRDRIAEAGGVLNGIYYIPQSFLTQKTRREEALKDLLSRFSTESGDCYLVSSSRSFLAVAHKLGIRDIRLDENTDLSAALVGLPAGG